MSKPYVIIGGGILGASTAFYLSKQGTEVILIDRHDKGQATDAAAGIICPWISQRRNKKNGITLPKMVQQYIHL